MAQIKFQKDKDGKLTGAMVTGVTFYYVSVRRPQPIFEDRKKPYDSARKQWRVTFSINEDIADQWDEIFGKQPTKKYTNAKFKEQFKLEEGDALPEPGEKKQYTLCLNQRTETKQGKPAKQPGVFQVVDGKAVEITNDKNVGNGSKGAIKIRVISGEMGTFAYPDKIRVDELVEWEDNSSSGLREDDLEFLGTDEVEFSETKADISSSKSSPSENEEPENDDDFGDDDF